MPEHPVVQYDIKDIPRDTDPASKIDLGTLESWWNGFDADAAELYILLNTIKKSWPASLPKDSWYIVAFSTLLTCGKPEAIAPIFKRLAHHLTEEGIKQLGNRFKDIVMKIFTIIGIPQVIIAVSHLARAEIAAVASLDPRAGEGVTRTRLNAFLSRDTQILESQYLPLDTGPAVDQKGFDFMLQLYRHNLPNIMATWQRHQADFEWLQMRVIYGTFLSDRTTLSSVESEMVVLPGIMAQDVLAPTVWHVRGMLRLGIDPADVGLVLETVKKCATFAGRDLKNTGSLRVEHVDVEWEPRP